MLKKYSRLSPLILLIALASCTSVRKMPHETFAKIPAFAPVVTPDCVEAGREDLRAMLEIQRTEAREVVEFWDKCGQLYESYLAQSPTPDHIDAMIDSLVEHYAMYSDKRSIRAELQGVSWPYGLQNMDLKAPDDSVNFAAAPSDPPSGLAARAWPGWVRDAQESRARIPRYNAGEQREWVRKYSYNREELLTFWISVSLTVRRQFAYLQAYESPTESGATMASPDRRPAFPLPLIKDYNDRMLRAFSKFSRFPVFRKDYDRFREVGGPDGCPVPPAEPYAFAEGWSALLFSRASAEQWLATARVGNDARELVAPALVRQAGGGWFLLPAIGWGEGAVDRFVMNNDDTAEPANRRAYAFSLWPLALYAKGEGLTMDGYEVQGSAWGVPLIYATGGFKNDRGTRYRMREALHFLLYWGEDVHRPSESRSTHAWGMGLLWYSHYNDRAGRALNGPLWGWFGWGHRRGEPVYRLFGIPFERQVDRS